MSEVDGADVTISVPEDAAYNAAGRGNSRGSHTLSIDRSVRTEAIIKNYMARHPETSLHELIAQKDPQIVLDKSRYRPK